MAASERYPAVDIVVVTSLMQLDPTLLRILPVSPVKAGRFDWRALAGIYIPFALTIFDNQDSFPSISGPLPFVMARLAIELLWRRSHLPDSAVAVLIVDVPDNIMTDFSCKRSMRLH